MINKALQEENERLKEELRQAKKDFKEANDYCFELKDYKSRIEKAIVYIKEKARNNCWIDQYEASNLINILQGDN